MSSCRQLARELGEAARHVIARRDDDQAVVAERLGPGARLVGIADGVERGVAEVDAAVELVLGRARRFSAARSPGVAVDAGNQQALGAALVQQPRALGDARARRP